VIFHSYVSLPEGKKQILPFTTYTNWPWRMDGWFRQSHVTPSHPSRHPRPFLRSFFFTRGSQRWIRVTVDQSWRQAWSNMKFHDVFPTFLWSKNRWCFHGFPMIFMIFADVRVRSGACLAAKETKQRHHAGVFRQKVDILWYVFFQICFYILWYVKLDRTNIWKIQKTWTLQSLRSFDPLDLLRLGPVMCHCFYEGPMGPGICCAGLLICFLFTC
jgi:hypothetical protein